MPLKPEINAVLSGRWQVDMMSTPSQSPMTCCYGFWCPCCFAYQQREKLLEITGEPYICCAGMCACGPCGKPCESKSPWLFLETCCCTNNAIMANRFMLQTRFDIQNDPCDEKLLAITACLNCICIIITMFSSERGSTDGCEAIMDCINASVCACMLTQQDIQIKAIEETIATQPYAGMSQQILCALPPQQQQMMGFAQIAPSGQYGAASPQYGTAAPRQMMVAVPPGTSPGQMVQFTTPEGVLVQVPVPAGLAPGQEFAAAY